MQARGFDDVGLAPADVLPWNAYPWFTGGAALSSGDKDAGGVALLRLIDRLPDLQVILLQGGTAKECWDRAAAFDPGLVDRRNLEVLDTYDPGAQALRHPDPAERERRRRHRLDSYREVAEIVRIYARGTEGEQRT